MTKHLLTLALLLFVGSASANSCVPSVASDQRSSASLIYGEHGRTTFHSSPALADSSLFILHSLLPKAQATHFCQLFLYDGETIMPISAHARKLMKATDSLTAEQLFTSFVFYQDNWQSLRIFPHVAADGTVAWYSPADLLVDAPSNSSLFTHHSSLSSEHQKYIREVLPRLRHEIMAGNWQTVDAYIDRMIQYQCRFGGVTRRNPVSGLSVFLLFFIFPALLFTVSLVLRLRRRNTQIV